MGLLNGDLASVFASVLGSIYLDAQLHRGEETDDGAGGGVWEFADPESVKAQVDQANQAMLQSQGYVDGDVRIIVLAAGVDPISTDDEITVSGQRYAIASITRDPANAYFDLRGRRA